MEDIEERIDDQDDELDEEELDEADADSDADTDAAEPPARAAGTARDGEQTESSLEEMLSKKEDRKPGEEDDDEESMLDLSREERLEPLAVKVVPQQPSEFVCKNCYLVKHRSQLADKTRGFCRDCV